MRARTCTSDIALLLDFVFTFASRAKSNEKSPIMTSFDILNKMMGPYLFSQTARETLGDKMELYFHDHSFVPLFIQVRSLSILGRLSLTLWIQENYLKTEPSRIRNLAGPDQTLVHLELMDKAASSISDGDLVDALIHGFVILQNIVVLITDI